MTEFKISGTSCKFAKNYPNNSQPTQPAIRRRIAASKDPLQVAVTVAVLSAASGLQPGAEAAGTVCINLVLQVQGESELNRKFKLTVTWILV